MPTVSDYTVLTDTARTLQVGGDIDTAFDFSLPQNLRTAASGNRAVASWQLEVEEPNSLKYRVRINGTEIGNYIYDAAVDGRESFAAIQEVFSSSILERGRNQADVVVLGGGGRIRISDFVVHFQVDV